MADPIASAGGLIDPSQIPGTTIQAETIASAGSDFTRSAGLVRQHGDAVTTVWGGLSAVYSAPESAQLIAVMNPVRSDTAVLADQISAVGAQISALAEAVGPIRRELVNIKSRAEAFVAKAAGGTTVDYWDPNHPAWDNGWFVGFMLQDFADMVPAHIPWNKYQPWIDENNALIAEVSVQVARLDEARATCVNAINALRADVCVAPAQAITVEQLNAAGAVLPWGTAGNGDRSCYESVNDGIAESFEGAVSGIGSLITRNPETGEWLDWGNAGASWVQMGTMLGSIALIGPAVPLVSAFAPKGSWAQEFATGVAKNQVAVVEGLVGSPAAWQENPAKAAGSLGFNVGSFFIPGAGVVGGAAKTGLFGARAAALVERATLALGKGGSAVVGAAGAVNLKVGNALTHLKDVLKVDGATGVRFDRALADLEGSLKHVDLEVGKPPAGLLNGSADGALPPGASHADVSHSPGVGAQITDASTPHGPHASAGDGASAPSSANPGASHSPLTDRQFDALSPRDQYDVALGEIGRDSVTFADNLDAHRYGADRWNAYADNLPQDQKTALLDYSKDPPHNPSYREINGALRGPGPIPDDLANTVAAIDQALAGKRVDEALVVARGTDLDHLNLSDPFAMIGRTYGDPAYTSTSLGQAAFGDKQAVLHLKVPVGTPAIYMEKVSHFGAGERELLLGRGTKYRVDRVILDEQGKWQIFGEVIVNE